MKRQKGIGHFFLIAILLVLAQVVWAGAARPEGVDNTPGIRSAIERSLPYLQHDGLAWMEGRIGIQKDKACVSCHQVPFAVWSQNAARSKDVVFEKDAFNDLTQQAIQFLARPGKVRVMSIVPLMLSGKGVLPERLSEPWQEFVAYIVSNQESEGYWKARGQFPSQNRPSWESDAVATMWTVLALSSINEPDDAILKSRNLALKWIRKSKEGISNEWLLTRFLVEHKLGDPEKVNEFSKPLLSQQKPDGGWSWLTKDESNTFSTGQTLYALNLGGIHPDHQAVRRGVSYLLNSQQEDGTWAVSSDLTSSEPSKGKDYVYRYWGTAWAVIGLARILEESVYSLAK